TYHRLVAFRKVSYDFDSDSQPYTFDVDDNYYEHEGYMREEDGKVYTLVATGTNEWGNPFMFPYIPGATDIPDTYTLEEKLLYDFTCGEGESYRALQTHGFETEEMNYKVMSVDHIEIDGEEHKLMRICPDDEWNYDYGHPVVEGIGIASYGCLTTINFLWLPSCPCMDHIFNRVLSMDGKMLYCSEDDYVDLPVGDLSGIDRLTDRTDDAAKPIYDMMGRRIAKPVPGQLYIQGGKKHIAK
ncbi:MAG: hypothetical protein K2H85_05435, partial [Allobaculum sp.]|nr:hypothetical protein [Allobaculum sp.]